jgi:DNA polymerase delta subunit 3
VHGLDYIKLLTRWLTVADVKSRLKTIFSIYIYSVEPTCPQDLNVLADLGYSLLEPQQEDPLEHGHRYGMIKNKNVKVRFLVSIAKFTDLHQLVI